MIGTAAIGTHLLPVVDPLAVIAVATAARGDDPADELGTGDGPAIDAIGSPAR